MERRKEEEQGDSKIKRNINVKNRSKGWKQKEKMKDERKDLEEKRNKRKKIILTIT